MMTNNKKQIGNDVTFLFWILLRSADRSSSCLSVMSPAQETVFYEQHRSPSSEEQLLVLMLQISK